jgi:hypothetical protein
MTRGGKRPGSGAPKGNLNALKHGNRSKQFARIGALLARSPGARKTLLDMAHRFDLAQATADQAATELLKRIYTHANDIARGKPSPGPFQKYLGLNAGAPSHERRSTRKKRPGTTLPTSARLQKSLNFAPDNQTAATKPAAQPETGYEDPPQSDD